MKPRLPDLIGLAFLAGDGFVGFRCGCGFVATGRTAHAVDFAIQDHARAAHPDEPDLLEDITATM